MQLALTISNDPLILYSFISVSSRPVACRGCSCPLVFTGGLYCFGSDASISYIFSIVNDFFYIYSIIFFIYRL